MKQCPFHEHAERLRVLGDDMAGYKVCCDCGGEGPNKDTEQAAIESWNRRAPAAEPTAGDARALLERAASATMHAQDTIGRFGPSETNPLYAALTDLRRDIFAFLAQRQARPSLGARDYLDGKVSAFASLMLREMRANDHKGGWSDDEPEDLFRRLREETAELWTELTAVGHLSPRAADDEAKARIAKEAADVANFAMMIVDRFGALPARPSLGAAADGDVYDGKNREITIGGVWLIRRGDSAKVLVEVAGQWRDVITTGIDGEFSHCAHPGGINSAPVWDEETRP